MDIMDQILLTTPEPCDYRVQNELQRDHIQDTAGVRIFVTR